MSDYVADVRIGGELWSVRVHNSEQTPGAYQWFVIRTGNPVAHGDHASTPLAALMAGIERVKFEVGRGAS